MQSFTKLLTLLILALALACAKSNEEVSVEEGGQATAVLENLVSTYAGLMNEDGHVDGPARVAKLNHPTYLAEGLNGNIYISDSNFHTIRKITPSGVVSTLAGEYSNAGDMDGPGTEARFFSPGPLVADSMGNLYVADNLNYKIKKITPAGIVSTFSGSGISGNDDGPKEFAKFNFISAMAIDKENNLFVSDTGNLTIRRIDQNGYVTLYAGRSGISGVSDGPKLLATFEHVLGLTIDKDSNIYVVEFLRHIVRKISSQGFVSTVAGTDSIAGSVDGNPAEALFFHPSDITIDSSGNFFIADSHNHIIRKMSPSGVVSTYAGVPSILGNINGDVATAQFTYPFGILVNKKDQILIADTYNFVIRIIK